MNSKKTIFIVVAVVLVGAAAFGVYKLLSKTTPAGNVQNFAQASIIGGVVSNSKVNDGKKTTTNSYKLDLRIFGNYNKQRYFEIVMVTNYQNKEKDITVTKSTDKGEEENKYLVKNSKYYSVKDETIKEVKSVPYSDTDIYLLGAQNLKEAKQVEDQKISDKTYNVYTGKVSKSVMNKILAATDLNIKVDKDIETEIWLNSEGYIYKIYYRFDGLTVYASYFGYNLMRGVDLSFYKTVTKN